MFSENYFQNISADLKEPKVNINCTMDDVRSCFLGMPHGTTQNHVFNQKSHISGIFKKSVKDF